MQVFFAVCFRLLVRSCFDVEIILIPVTPRSKYPRFSNSNIFCCFQFFIKLIAILSIGKML